MTLNGQNAYTIKSNSLAAQRSAHVCPANLFVSQSTRLTDGLTDRICTVTTVTRLKTCPFADYYKTNIDTFYSSYCRRHMQRNITIGPR